MEYIDVADKFGLTVNLLKTKLLVMGYGLTEEDKAPIVVGGDTIERVDEFPYLGSVVMSSGRIDIEVNRHLAGASRAFGALRHAVFNDSNLTITTKHKVYQSCILSVLLHVCECWTTLHMQTTEQAQCLPSSVHSHCTGDNYQTAVGAAHHHLRDD